MICIISGESTTTSEIMAWLAAMGKEYIRINDDDRPLSLRSIRLDTNGVSIQASVAGVPLDLDRLSCLFVRHGFLGLETSIHHCIHEDHFDIYRSLNDQIQAIKDLLESILLQLPALGSLRTQDVNKLIALRIAQKHGLRIPTTLVTTEGQQAYEFVGQGNSVTKAVQNVTHIIRDGIMLMNYTEVVEPVDLKGDRGKIHPSLFQARIPKLFEVRTFYLLGRCYSMAIFSQANDRTSVDFRKYDQVKPNRCVPYSLPRAIEMKITALMNDLALDTGSIDIIVDVNMEHVFLEVNPVGQFGMVSYPCNYHLEEQVAKTLALLSEGGSKAALYHSHVEQGL